MANGIGAMGQQNQACAPAGNCDVGKVAIKSKTVKETFDENIAHARKRVENLCIAKAKAETLGWHDLLFKDLQSVLEELYPF